MDEVFPLKVADIDGLSLLTRLISVVLGVGDSKSGARGCCSTYLGSHCSAC